MVLPGGVRDEKAHMGHPRLAAPRHQHHHAPPPRAGSEASSIPKHAISRDLYFPSAWSSERNIVSAPFAQAKLFGSFCQSPKDGARPSASFGRASSISATHLKNSVCVVS